MVRHEGHVDKVSCVKKIYSDLDQCEVRIGFDTYTAFYPFSELQELQDKDVSYVLRKDIVDGKDALVITEITLLAVVQTVKENSGVKLCPVNESRGVCNFNAATAQVHSTYPHSIVMVTSFKHGSSSKSKWVDLACLDKKSKAINLRVFDSTVDAQEAEAIYKDYVGKYIRADIRYTPYGFQCDQPELLNISTAVSPSVALAKAIVMEEMKAFPDIVELDGKIQYISKLETLIAPEPGWALVRIATLLNLINNVDNIIVGADIDLMKKAALLSQLHAMPTKHEYTDEVKTILFLRNSAKLGTDDNLLQLMMGITPDTETAAVYDVIRNTAEGLNEVRYFYGG